MTIADRFAAVHDSIGGHTHQDVCIEWGAQRTLEILEEDC